MVAYAIGLLVAGRFIDKVGTRIGYMVIMAVWSLSAMGHALANSVLEFGIMRFTLGLGESGNFPAAIKTTAEWFPQSERSLATGIFNSGTNLGAILAPIIVPWVTIYYGWHAAFLVTGVFSATWICLWYRQIPQAQPITPRSPALNCGISTKKQPRRWAHPYPGANCSVTVRPGHLLPANSSPIPSGGSSFSICLHYFSTKFHLDISHLGLPLIIIYSASTSRQHRRRLVARSFPPLRAHDYPRATCGHAHLRLPDRARFPGQLSQLRMGRHRTAQPGDGGTPGLVG